MNFIESVKVKDGVVMNMEFHLERMKKSIGKLHNTDFTIPEEYRVGIVKMRILYNEETIKDVSFQKYKYPEINSLKMVEGNDICYGLKFEDRTAINNLYLQKEECDDILIIKDGFVTDTSFCNIIFVKNNTCFTPDTPLLEGI